MRSLIPNVNLSDVDAQALLAEVERNNLLTELREVLDARPQAQMKPKSPRRSPRRSPVPEVWYEGVVTLALKLESENRELAHPKSLRATMAAGASRYVRPDGKSFSGPSLEASIYRFRDIQASKKPAKL